MAFSASWWHQNNRVSYEGEKKKTFSSGLTFLLLLRLYRSYRDTHPFVEEGHKAIAFWFSCGHVFDHPTVPADTNPVCDIVKCDSCRVIQTGWKSNTYDIFPKGPKAALMSSVVISGLRSPTKTWKWPEANEYLHGWSDKQHINPATFHHGTLNINTGLIIIKKIIQSSYLTKLPNFPEKRECLSHGIFEGWDLVLKMANWPFFDFNNLQFLYFLIIWKVRRRS